jgi:hypothetical protein
VDGCRPSFHEQFVEVMPVIQELAFADRARIVGQPSLIGQVRYRNDEVGVV